MTKEIISGREEILNFFKEKNIRYLNRTRIEWTPLLKMKLDKSPYYKENRKEFKDLDDLYGKDIEQSLIAPVYIKKISDSVGYGLFAGSDLKKGDFIGEYTGVVKVCEELTESFEDGSWETDFSWDFPDETGSTVLEINGRLEGNELRFVNHHKNYNLDVEHTLHKGMWLIFFIARKNIKSGEQLFVSYGDEYWSGGFRQISDLDKNNERPDL